MTGARKRSRGGCRSWESCRVTHYCRKCLRQTCRRKRISRSIHLCFRRWCGNLRA